MSRRGCIRSSLLSLNLLALALLLHPGPLNAQLASAGGATPAPAALAASYDELFDALLQMAPAPGGVALIAEVKRASKPVAERTASRIAAAIRAGRSALVTAVASNTASQPSSIASAASDAVPIPASSTIGTARSPRSGGCFPAESAKARHSGCCSTSSCVKQIASFFATTSACRPIPRAGAVKSFHCSYFSESEKYLRAWVQSPATSIAMAAW